jgi:hypothetical protein
LFARNFNVRYDPKNYFTHAKIKSFVKAGFLLEMVEFQKKKTTHFIVALTEKILK